ncbi:MULTISPECIES: hypothetical protein [unclassified Micromonospora]|uniref:hypothetical protein n=1 Tax=unclassified Micromonospora TaxID=2617518 RepID=UPI0036265FA5
MATTEGGPGSRPTREELAGVADRTIPDVIGPGLAGPAGQFAAAGGSASSAT